MDGRRRRLVPALDEVMGGVDLVPEFPGSQGYGAEDEEGRQLPSQDRAAPDLFQSEPFEHRGPETF